MNKSNIIYVGPQGAENGLNSDNEHYSLGVVKDVLDYFATYKGKYIQCDLETSGLDCHINRINLMQLGTKEVQFVVDIRYHDISQFKDIIENPNITLLGHNFKFDYKFLKRKGIQCENIYDTMLGEAVIYNGIKGTGLSLEATVSRRLEILLDKDEQSNIADLGDKMPTTAQIIYSGKDVQYLEDVKEGQDILISNYDLQYALDLENKCVPVFGDMEYYGIGINDKAWIANAAENEKLLREKTSEIDRIVSDIYKDSKSSKGRVISKQVNMFTPDVLDISIKAGKSLKKFSAKSSQQVTKVLQKLIPQYSITASSVEVLDLYQEEHIFIKEMLIHRKIAKAVSTYGRKFLKEAKNKITGRIHTDFWQVLVTFRVSSGRKKNKDDDSESPTRPNMQNIPSSNNYRNCFIPRKGFTWNSFDFSGQELAVMGFFGNEAGYVDVYRNNGDLHCYVGSILTGKTITKADKKERTAAKSINFLVPYGGGADKLASKLKITKEEAQKLLDTHRRKFPNLHKWLDTNAHSAKTKGYIRLPEPHKGIRWMPEISKTREERQSSSPDWRKIMVAEGSAEREGKNTPKNCMGVLY